MSAELYTVSGPGGNDASLQGTTVGGSKPLHRFMKGQPRAIGVVVLVLGSSFFIISIAMADDGYDDSLLIATPSGFIQGVLFIICGIMYILTEHNPTKKTVTISLALSIVSILATLGSDFNLLIRIERMHYYRRYDLDDTEDGEHGYNIVAMERSLTGILLFYSLAGAIVLIVMSTLAGAALRSPKSQAVVMMMAAPTETPAEVGQCEKREEL